MLLVGGGIVVVLLLAVELLFFAIQQVVLLLLVRLDCESASGHRCPPVTPTHQGHPSDLHTLANFDQLGPPTPSFLNHQRRQQCIARLY